jgi:hypothetical protein
MKDEPFLRAIGVETPWVLGYETVKDEIFRKPPMSV